MIEIRLINGIKGVFATKILQNNQIVHTLFGKTRITPSQTSIEIGKDNHIEDSIGRYINHSFNPSTRISGLTNREHTLQCGFIVSLRTIQVGDEITFNYNESESKLASPFHDRETGLIVSGKK